MNILCNTLQLVLLCAQFQTLAKKCTLRKVTYIECHNYRNFDECTFQASLARADFDCVTDANGVKSVKCCPGGRKMDLF